MANDRQSTQGDRQFPSSEGNKQQFSIGAVLTSPFLWGGLATIAFYQAIPHSPYERDLLIRYFTGHWILYSTTALFFIGLAVLLIKFLQSFEQTTALSRFPWTREGRVPWGERVELVASRIDQARIRWPRSWIVERYQQVLSYLQARGSADSIEEHLKYRSEQAGDQLYASYALVRTITWAVPILGFLGTVLGITIAIAEIRPNELESSLNEVIGGLGLAFDTTALSLTLSLILVFVSYCVERVEERVLGELESRTLIEFVGLFPPTASLEDQSAHVRQEIARRSLEQSEELIRYQSDLWKESLEGMRQRWMGTLESLQNHLAGSLEESIRFALGDQASQLHSWRQEFVQETYRSSLELQVAMREWMEKWQKNINSQEGILLDRLEGATRAVADSVQRLEPPLRLFSETADQTSVRLAELSDRLEQLGGDQHQLLKLERELSDNLYLLRSAGSFDEAVHSLTAAVHILTGRSRAA